MIEAFQTKKGMGLITSDEGKQRGPYTVQVLLDGDNTSIRVKNPKASPKANPDSKRVKVLTDARAWVRKRIGQLRKANPSQITRLFEQAEQAGEQWSARNPDVDAWDNEQIKAVTALWKKGKTGGILPDGQRSVTARQIVAAASKADLTMHDFMGIFERDYSPFWISSYGGWSAMGMRDRNPARRNPGPGLLDPTGSRLYESFHGKPSTKVSTIKQVTYSRDDLAQLGVLISIKVHLVTAKQAEIKFPESGRDSVLLCSSPDGTQLYFVGGDQTLDLHQLGLAGRKWFRDSMVLGVTTEITYRTRKGFDKFQMIDYYHGLGEDTDEKPMLIYDTINSELSVAGGQYEVKPEGIVN